MQTSSDKAACFKILGEHYSEIFYTSIAAKDAIIRIHQARLKVGHQHWLEKYHCCGFFMLGVWVVSAPFTIERDAKKEEVNGCGMEQDIDILVVTHSRRVYTRLTLEQLFATCDDTMRVWIWHNGDDEETLEVTRSMTSHPRLYKFHHSVENKRLIEPINWLWTNARGQYLCKVDDDSLMPDGWAQKLRQAHQDVPEFGVIACWHFRKEDFRPALASKKIREFRGGHQLLQNCWVQGSGVMMKRACLETAGLLKAGRGGHPAYCIKLAASGWVNGWYYPLICMEHMDDPRSPHSLLKSDEDFQRYMPSSAKDNNNVKTLAQWQAQLQRSAIIVQKASLDPRHYQGWRWRLRTIWRSIRVLFGLPAR